MKSKGILSKWPVVFACALSLFLVPTTASGDTFCVSNSTALQNALTTAASNGSDDVIKIVQGTYAGNFVYASTEPKNLSIEGGYNDGCNLQTTDPENTVLDGGGADHVLVLVDDELEADFFVRGLKLSNGRSSTAKDGGGLYIQTGRKVTLTNNIFSGNVATGNGGGACILNSSDATVTDNIFVGNSTGDSKERYCSGGGLFIGEGALTITNNKFENNCVTALLPKGGGAYLYSQDSNATIKNNSFLENTADNPSGYSGHGGGAYVSYSQVVMSDNFFRGNICLDNNNSQGGGLCLFSNNISLVNSYFENNKVGNGSGGGAFIRGDNVVTVIKNVFTNNSGTSGGSTITSAGGTVKIEDNLFSQNESNGDDYRGGGAFFNKSGDGDFTLRNNVFLDNISKISGGGALLWLGTEDSSTYNVENNSFLNNSVLNGDGGGLLVWLTFSNGGALNFYNNQFVENKAFTGKGGGICINGDKANIYLVNNTLYNNIGKAEGGGIWFLLSDKDFEASLFNNIIWGNSSDKGNDIYIDNSGKDPFFPVTVDIYNNDFEQSASGIYITKPFSIDPSNLDNDNPLFVSSTNYHLSVSSPCVNKGNNAAPNLPSTDKDGNPRIVNAIVDIGAYEYNALAPISDAGRDQTVSIGQTVTLDGSDSSDPSGKSLTYAWNQIGGVQVSLSDSNAIQPTFIVPESLGGGTSLDFLLTVTNTDNLKNTDTVEVKVLVNPTISTTTLSLITHNSATTGGNVTSDGGADITARGVCWSTSENPTINDSKTSDGTGTGSFTSEITGLDPGETYHVRAYATNSAGLTGYGGDLSFETSTTTPTVTTMAVSSITSTSVSSGGNITSDGGADITAKGVCWSTSSNPTTSNDKTSDGTGTGEFTSSITDLSPGTIYHVRAYATNSEDKTGYGEDRPFTTSAPSSIFYVSKNDSTCGNNSPCYSTIQEALSAASAGDIVKVSQGTYTEKPARNTTGTVSISGGWNNDFTDQTGTTEMYAPSATGGGGVKVLPRVKVVPH